METHVQIGRGLQVTLLAAGLLTLAVVVSQLIAPFLPALTWSVVFVLVTWPIHAWIKRQLGFSPTGSALVTTGALAATFTLAVLPLLVELISEAHTALKAVNAVAWPTIETELRRIPVVGARLAEARVILSEDGIVNHLLAHRQELFGIISQGISEIAGAVVTLALATFISFFLYRDGPVITRHITALVEHIGGSLGLRFVLTATAATRAAVYGTVLTSLVQGLIAALGFWLFDAPTPVLLGLATMLLSLIPFGSPLVYLPVAGYLVISGDSWHQGVFLALWGAAFVSTADNILRPLFISQAAELSLLLVFFGVVGGLLQFGMVGIFLGPAILAVARSVWITYLESIATPPRVTQAAAP